MAIASGITAATALKAAAVASVGIGAYTGYQQVQAAKTQQIVDESAIRLQTEQTRLQASRQAASSARNFRQALASQVALSQFRGGAGSLTRQFSSEAFSSFLEDQGAISRGLRVNDIRSMNLRANAAAKRSLANTQAFSNFGSSVFSGAQAYYLGTK